MVEHAVPVVVYVHRLAVHPAAMSCQPRPSPQSHCTDVDPGMVTANHQTLDPEANWMVLEEGEVLGALDGDATVALEDDGTGELEAEAAGAVDVDGAFAGDGEGAVEGFTEPPVETQNCP